MNVPKTIIAQTGIARTVHKDNLCKGAIVKVLFQRCWPLMEIEFPIPIANLLSAFIISSLVPRPSYFRRAPPFSHRAVEAIYYIKSISV